MTTSRRIISNFFANSMGKFWVLLIQLITVPVVTHKWGATDYGVWLMLTTVPTYVSLGSLGFGAAAAVDMTRHYAQGDKEGTLRTFQSVWILISSVLFAVLLLELLFWLLHSQIFSLFPTLSVNTDVLYAALILVVYSVVAIEMNFMVAGFQGTRRYAEGILLYDLSMPVETLALIAICLLGGSMTAVALAMLVLRSLATVAFYLRLLHYEPWMKLGWSHASKATIKRLAHPALATLSMTMSSALSLEGLILSLGLFVSPAATAVFATSRMVTRIPLQLVGLASRATMPEMTAAFSRGDRALSAKLVIFNLGFAGAIAVPFALVFMLFGPYVLDLLSHHRLHAGAGLFACLALVALFQATWNTFAQFLYAVNKHHKFAYFYIALAVVTAAAPIFVGHSSTVTRSAVVWCVDEAIMLAIVYRAWWSETDLNYSAISRAVSDIITDGRSLVRRTLGGEQRS